MDGPKSPPLPEQPKIEPGKPIGTSNPWLYLITKVDAGWGL
jgi:hypothetical protein